MLTKQEWKSEWYLKINYAVNHNARTLPVANVSTEQLGGHGIIFYQTDLLGKSCTHYTITPFIVKTKLHGIC
jgi:hypothetical protein